MQAPHSAFWHARPQNRTCRQPAHSDSLPTPHPSAPLPAPQPAEPAGSSSPLAASCASCTSAAPLPLLHVSRYYTPQTAAAPPARLPSGSLSSSSSAVAATWPGQERCQACVQLPRQHSRRRCLHARHQRHQRLQRPSNHQRLPGPGAGTGAAAAAWRRHSMDELAAAYLAVSSCTASAPSPGSWLHPGLLPALPLSQAGQSAAAPAAGQHCARPPVWPQRAPPAGWAFPCALAGILAL